MRLNLGCGGKPLDGFINHDVTQHSPWVDVAWDLNELPWPWGFDAFETVVALSVLEHLYHNLLVSMDEIWRITAPDGLAVIKLPYWKAEISWEDPSHIHKVGPRVFHQLDPRTKRGQKYDFYTRRKWAIQDVKFNDGRTSIIWKMRKRLLDWNPEGRNGKTHR